MVFMSTLLLLSNTIQYNINSLLCTYTEMFRIQTCCNHNLSAAERFQGAGGNMRGSRNFCQFYLDHSLFYSLKRGSNGFIAEKTILILYKGSRGGPLFSGGGGCPTFFQEGGGPNANFYRNTYTYLSFSRGSVWTPYPPSGSTHGTIFITVRPLTIIVRPWFVRINDRWGFFQMIHWYCARLTPSRYTVLGSGSSCNSAFFSPNTHFLNAVSRTISVTG